MSFELPEGQILGLIGSDSAGKTTMFNVISGVLLAGERTGDFPGDITGLPPCEIAWRGLAAPIKLSAR